MTTMIYVGIDTGVHTGFAVWDSAKCGFLTVTSMKLHRAMDEVRRIAMEEKERSMGIVVRVEDPRQRTWFGTDRMSRDEERKKLQGVGSVKRDASIWEDFLTDLNVEFQMVAPRRNVTKMTSDRFRSLTKWDRPTNEHGRDAAMLVFGY